MTTRGLILPLLAVLASFIFPGAARAVHHVPTGRFLQADPNATGLTLIDQVAYGGMGLMPGVNRFDLETNYWDGPNTYQYLGSNTWTRSDPLGLSWDPFDDAFAIEGEHLWSGLVGVNQALYLARDGIRLARAYERAAHQWDDLVRDRDEAILLGMVIAPFFSKICFVEGTPVATPEGPEPIERLALGGEVVSRQDPEHLLTETIDLPADAGAIRLVTLRYAHASGAVTTMELLRPAQMLANHGIIVGSRLPLSLPEMGFAANAEVLAVEPFEGAVRLDVPVVTGRFVTDAAEVVDVYLEGHTNPIGVTPRHPIFSADRRTWVASGDLRAGERLGTLGGTTAVVRCVEPRLGRHPVYNVEVSRHHTYFVGEAGVWAHNPCSVTFAPGTHMPGGRMAGAWPAVGNPSGNRVWASNFHVHATEAAVGSSRLPKGWISGLAELDEAGRFIRWIGTPDIVK